MLRDVERDILLIYVVIDMIISFYRKNLIFMEKKILFLQ
jgi:hypothetical protein